MAVFAYKVMGATGRAQAGTMTADTPAEGRARLRDQGLRVLQFRTATARRERGRRAVSLRRPGRQREQVAEVARHLALLLRSGVTLVDALDVLIRQQTGRMETVLRDVRERVAGGATLADALTLHPRWFDPIFLSAVRIGEVSGSLDESLTGLAAFVRRRQTLTAKLTGALIYPCVLLCLGIAVVLFLMSAVIPQLLTVLVASGKPLPASTMLLKHGSDALVNYWWLLLAGVTSATALCVAVLRTERGLLAWHRLVLRIPLVGPLLSKAVVAQFAQMTTMLLHSGIPFTDAIETVARSVRNRVLRAELGVIKTAVEAGSDVAPALEGSRIFPPLVQHLVAVGQNTGELAEMLGQLKAGYETEVSLALSRFTAALEPLLIVVLAALIGFVVFATMMPILEATRVMA